jgi:DHA1 family tetracycline resistance protein-like MFS transporter
MPPRNERERLGSDGVYRHYDAIDSAPNVVDNMVEIAPFRRTSVLKRDSFIAEFVSAPGPRSILILCMLLALGFGSTVGVVPAVMADRYARLQHGFNGPDDCSTYGMASKPPECLAGFADAQNAVAMEQLLSNLLTFFTSSLVGSLSDEYGRKSFMVAGVFLSLLSPLTLVLLQMYVGFSPNWYYAVGAFTGLINWITVALSSLSDVMPAKWRAPSFGMLMAGFSLGFAIAPQLALVLGHFRVSVFAFLLVLMGFFVTLFFYPETLLPETAIEAQIVREELVEGLTQCQRIVWNIKRPVWELSILNRNRLFRLLSALAFFSGLVSAGDRSLLIYYIEERIGFNDKDVALMFMIMGILGIFVQGLVLKFLNELIGERRVVALCFCLGTFYNVLYGFATTKLTIFVAVALSAFGGMAFPTISAIKANNVESSEQGRIQGALYSLSALASALGPIALRCVYHYTKDGALFGPGSMFIFAAGLYLIAVYCAFSLPVRYFKGDASLLVSIAALTHFSFASYCFQMKANSESHEVVDEDLALVRSSSSQSLLNE